VGRPARRADIRVARYVYVSDSVKKAKAELRETLGDILQRRKRGFAYQFESIIPPGGGLDDVTFDYMVDAGAIWVGDPDTVYGHIKSAHEEIGGFGVLLLLVGMDAGSRQQRARSLRLFAKHVAPRLA
jgi:alkanesulfonate monooxygenase SsuD/methylene tetrahydromethanopterin reductase-like flavin-dependent oxidoreductase (luciferase family)